MFFQFMILIIVAALLVIFSKNIAELSTKLWKQSALRHLTLLLAIALLVICFTPYLHIVLREVLIFYYLGAKYIIDIIGPGQIDTIIAKTVMLLLVPLAVCIVPQFLFWLIGGRGFKFFYSMLWACFILLASIVVIR